VGPFRAASVYCQKRGEYTKTFASILETLTHEIHGISDVLNLFA
jgi:hypothetical protein